MTFEEMNRLFILKVKPLLKRFIVPLLRTLLMSIISLIFVQIPKFCYFLITFGKIDEKVKLQNRIRSKLTNPLDPSSPYRAIEVGDELLTTPNERVQTLADLPDYALQHYADKETLGVREILSIEDEKQPNGKIFKKFIMGEYKFTTYRESFNRIEAIGRGLLSIGVRPGDKILIFAETRPEWLLTALGALRHGLTIVTLYSTLGEEAVKYGINESQVSILITSHELFPKLEKTLDHTAKVRHVIYFPPLTKSQTIKLPKLKNDIEFLALEQLEENGKNAQIDEDILKKRPNKDDPAVIMYTSGSTGTPKGVLIKHENIIAAMTGQQERVFPLVDVDTDIYIAYLPLAHILELSCEMLTYYMGVKTGYSSPQTLTDQSTAIKRGHKGDLQVLRPHIMSCVPTILDRLHKAVNEKLNQSNFFRRYLFRLTYKIKVKRLEYGLDTPILNKLIFNRLNDMVLGGRVKTMMCGGAVLSEDTQRFVQAALCVSLFQGYGLTETCAAATIADQYDTTVGRAGYPLVSCEIRLANWDEGQYKNTDKPNPRGEILVGGKIIAAGYVIATANENENFQEIDGVRYFCTGDIGEMYPNGTLKIIDRKKDLVKLRGGEYVSLSKVEVAITKFSIVENCCLYASPSAEYTVLLICPNPKQLAAYAEKYFGEKDWQKLIDDEEFNEQILKDVHETCKKCGVENFEIPKRVKLVTESWTPETGLVTDALKLKRKAIEQKYQEDIDDLYYDRPKTKSSKRSKKPQQQQTTNDASSIEIVKKNE